ncbi:MAG: lipase family protein [Pseudomonadota bacterium]
MTGTMLSGRNAAILADAGYAVTTARTNDQALEMAQEDVRYTENYVLEQNLTTSVTPIGGIVGTSGNIVTEQAGFGTLLQRHAGVDREFILVMRGTQTKIDWLSNLNIGMTRGPTGTLVHTGFAAIYDSLRQDVKRMIAAAKPQRMHFVGHSLGGALATLSAVDFAQGKTCPSHLYTFGAPRVGGLALGGEISRVIGDTRVKRVYAQSDPVPMIPLFPFFHAGPGTTGINGGFSSITAAAHSMSGCYIPKMPGTGWPAAAAMPSKLDPDYWLTQAEKTNGIGSTMGYYFLGLALGGILPWLHATSAQVTASLTMLDLLAEGLYRAASLAAQVGKLLLRFVKSALRFAGGVATAGLSLADITVSFLRYVLGLMMGRVIQAARSALQDIR